MRYFQPTRLASLIAEMMKRSSSVNAISVGSPFLGFEEGLLSLIYNKTPELLTVKSSKLRSYSFNVKRSDIIKHEVFPKLYIVHFREAPVRYPLSAISLSLVLAIERNIFAILDNGIFLISRFTAVNIVFQNNIFASSHIDGMNII